MAGTNDDLPFFQVFTYLCNFLREVFRLKGRSGLEPKSVAPLFATVMLRDPPASSPPGGARGGHAAAAGGSSTVPGGGLRARHEQHELENRKLMFLSRFVNPAVTDPAVAGTDQPTWQ